jgi:PhnB protein
MTATVKTTPEGYHTATPALTVDDGAKALEFYVRAFSAKKRNVSQTPDGKMIHGEFQIGDSVFMLADEFPGMGNRSPKSLGGSSFGIWLYVSDADAVYHQAIAAGATSMSPPTDMFWGDRFASVRDPFGHVWSIATHREDVPPAEMERRSKEFFAKMANRGP